LPIDVDYFFISTHIDILWSWFKMSKNNCIQLHFVKWNIYKLQQLNKLFDNFWIMHFWRHNHRRLFKSWPWIKNFIVFGEAFVRSSNLRLWNSFEPFWKNEGKTSHSLKEMPLKFSPPITSKKLQIIVNINKNKFSF